MAELVTVARPYAEAAFKTALEQNRLGPMGEGLEFLAAVARDDQMRSVISNPKVSAQQKKDLFAAIGGDRFDGPLKNLIAILVAMWAGAWVSRGFASMGATLPGYIGAMLVAAAIRNLDDATGLIGLSQRTIDDLGSVSLSLFLVLALMTLKLWELVGLAVPLAIILAGQVALIAAVCLTVIPWLMGRDYEGAVMSSGFCGFMLGTTANSMANMEALVERYGPAPKAFLVVPMVGAFFIDFTNAIIITVFLNLFAPHAA